MNEGGASRTYAETVEIQQQLVEPPELRAKMNSQ